MLVAWGAMYIEFHQIAAFVVTALVHGGLYLAAVVWILRRPPQTPDLWLILGAALLLQLTGEVSSPRQAAEAAAAAIDDGSARRLIERLPGPHHV